MNEVVKFITDHSDTDTNIKNGQMVIEAYNADGDIIDIYLEPESEIADYFERKYKESELSGSELVAEEFNGNYHRAFIEIKEDLEP